MKRNLIAILALLLAAPLSAQFIAGWSGGYGNPQELNRVIHVYNKVNGHNLTKEMQPVHWSEGLCVGYRMGDGSTFVELLYSRKRIMVHSEFDSSGVAFERQLRVMNNTWNFGLGVTDGEHLSLGASFDLGRFKGFGRRGPSDAIGDMKYTKLWVLDASGYGFIEKWYVASTIFAEAKFGFIALRGYFQFAWTKLKMDGLEYWMFGNALNWYLYEKDKYSNAGLMLTIQIGGK